MGEIKLFEKTQVLVIKVIKSLLKGGETMEVQKEWIKLSGKRCRVWKLQTTKEILLRASEGIQLLPKTVQLLFNDILQKQEAFDKEKDSADAAGKGSGDKSIVAKLLYGQWV